MLRSVIQYAFSGRSQYAWRNRRKQSARERSAAATGDAEAGAVAFLTLAAAGMRCSFESAPNRLPESRRNLRLGIGSRRTAG
jgi:hypothetical protein